MNSKKELIQCRADKALVKLLAAGVKDTGMDRAEVMRQGLYIGVPELVNRMRPKPATAGK